MYLKEENCCIFVPEEDVKKSIKNMQKDMGELITALITPETYFKIRKTFSDRIKDYKEEVPNHYMPITRFENTKGIVDFMVIGDVDE